jgi:NADPH:quinone reductase-like Zn-dependent oxidoreductase
MKAVEIPQFGIEHLRVVNQPEPPSPGPGQVLVDMKAWSLNYRDYLVVLGQYNPKLALPFVPLSDGAGVVAAVGEGVTRVKPGDRVCGTFFQGWIAGEYQESYAKTALGGAIAGILAERVLLSAEGVVKAPDHLSFQEAATLPCAALTAWNALVEQGSLKAGDTVLVQGTGGVSIFALQFAKLHGARVVVTSSSDAKLHRAQGLGADGLINYVQTPDWDKRAKEWNGGRGVDHVIEVGGIGTFERSLNVVRGAGRISYIGVLAGRRGEVSATWIFHKSLTVQGIYVGSRTMFENMNRAICAARLKPVVDRIYPLDEAAAALRHLESGGHFGKVCLEVGG